MKPTEIRELTTPEIVTRLEEAQTELMKSRINHAVSAIENPASIRKTRREVARLKTILTERNNAGK